MIFYVQNPKDYTHPKLIELINELGKIVLWNWAMKSTCKNQLHLYIYQNKQPQKDVKETNPFIISKRIKYVGITKKANESHKNKILWKIIKEDINI